MNEEAQLLLVLWETVQEHIPTNQKVEVAYTMIRKMMDYGCDLKLLRDAEDEDQFIEVALQRLFDYEEEEEDNLFDYEEEDEEGF